MKATRTLSFAVAALAAAAVMAQDYYIQICLRSGENIEYDFSDAPAVKFGTGNEVNISLGGVTVARHAFADVSHISCKTGKAGIDDARTEATVVESVFYDLSGVCHDTEPADGIYIRLDSMSDGKTKVTKSAKTITE